jgi:hypothetical protein
VSSNFERRLAKIEQALAETAKREQTANCTCLSGTVANSLDPESFEEEMNRGCHSHGFRRLGQILCVRFVNSDRTPVESPTLDDLLRTYELRLSQAAHRERQ